MPAPAAMSDSSDGASNELRRPPGDQPHRVAGIDRVHCREQRCVGHIHSRHAANLESGVPMANALPPIGFAFMVQ